MANIKKLMLNLNPLRTKKNAAAEIQQLHIKYRNEINLIKLKQITQLEERIKSDEKELLALKEQLKMENELFQKEVPILEAD